MRISGIVMLALVMFAAACNPKPASDSGAADALSNEEGRISRQDQHTSSRGAIDSLSARRFEPAFISVDDLVLAFLEAVAIKDAAALRSLLVSEREFNEWLWPEFPMSDPSMNVPEGFAWQNLASKSDKGLRAILKVLGGKSYTARNIRFLDPEEKYRSFKVLSGTRLDLTNARETLTDISFLGSVVELNGTYKFMSYRE